MADRNRRDRALAGGNAGDPVQVRQKGQEEQYARDRRLNGWRYLLATPLGRELAWGHLVECHVFETIMAPDPIIYANAGRHDWGLQMWAEMLDADEALCLTMQREAMARDRTRDTTKDTTKDTTDGAETDG